MLLPFNKKRILLQSNQNRIHLKVLCLSRKLQSHRISNQLNLSKESRQLGRAKNQDNQRPLNLNVKFKTILHLKVTWTAATWFTPSCIQKTSYLRTMGKKTNTTLNKNTMRKCRRNRNSPTMRMAIARIYTRLETILQGGSNRKSWPRFTLIVIT